MTDSRIEYLEAVKKENLVKTKYMRRKEIRQLPDARLSAMDRRIKTRSVAKWKKRYRTASQARKTARKDYEEAHKAFDAFREDESRGHIRDNNIIKQGSQYRTKWTHLPE